MTRLLGGLTALLLLAAQGCAPVEEEASAAATAPQEGLLARALGRADAKLLATKREEALRPVAAKAAALRGLAADEVRLQKAHRAASGATHARYTQVLHGLEVVGADLRLHVRADGEVAQAELQLATRPAEAPKPALSKAQALRAAERGVEAARVPGVTVRATQSRLVYFKERGVDAPRLAYQVLLEAPYRAVAYVDAGTGALIAESALDIHVGDRRLLVKQFSGSGALEYQITHRDEITGKPVQTNSPRPSAVQAWVQMQRVHACVQRQLGLIGWNNGGMSVSSTIDQMARVDAYASDPGGGASPLEDNAVARLPFSAGDDCEATGCEPPPASSNYTGPPTLDFGVGLYDFEGGSLAQSLDIVAHEYGHALTYFDGAAFSYAEQGASLHEALADILAALCERDAALYPIADDPAAPTAPGTDPLLLAESILHRDVKAHGVPALRSLRHPQKSMRPQVDYYAEPFDGSTERRYMNAGIVTQAFSLLVEGGQHPTRPGVVVPGLGLERAAKLFLFTSLHGWSASNATLRDFAADTLEAALRDGDLGFSTADRAAVCKAWEAVGIAVPACGTPREGDLVSDSLGRVILITKGEKWHIPSPEMFNRLGYDWGRIVPYPDYVLEPMPWVSMSWRYLQGFSDRCADVHAPGRYDNGVHTQLWDCLSPGSNQLFAFMPDGTVRAPSGMCLDAAVNVSWVDKPVRMVTCHGDEHQRWRLDADGRIRGWGGYCLAIDDSQALVHNGSGLVLQPCDGSEVQAWRPHDLGGWHAAPPPPVRCGRLFPDQSLARGASLRACNGAATLVHQGDGNVVVYDRAGALWATNTNTSSSTRFTMQGDGNLVLYRNFTIWGRTVETAAWASNTAGYGGSTLVMQEDCNLVMYGIMGHVIWATNRGCR